MATDCDKCCCTCAEDPAETPESNTFKGLMNYLSKVNLDISVLAKDNRENIKKLKEQIIVEEKELEKIDIIGHFMNDLIKSCYSTNLNDVALLDLMTEEKKQAVRTVKQCIDAGVVNCYRKGEEIEQFLTMREEEIAHQFKVMPATLCALSTLDTGCVPLRNVPVELLRFYNNTNAPLIMLNLSKGSTNYPYFVIPVHDTEKTYLSFDKVPEEVYKSFLEDMAYLCNTRATESPVSLIRSGKLTIKFPVYPV